MQRRRFLGLLAAVVGLRWTPGLDAPHWTSAQQAIWRAQWEQTFVGVDLATAADSSVYLLVIPPPLVGVLEQAAFSHIREQHKQLYRACLDPWLRTNVDRQLGFNSTGCIR